jgi:hypothetical protein
MPAGCSTGESTRASTLIHSPEVLDMRIEEIARRFGERMTVFLDELTILEDG